MQGKEDYNDTPGKEGPFKDLFAAYVGKNIDWHNLSMNRPKKIRLPDDDQGGKDATPPADPPGTGRYSVIIPRRPEGHNDPGPTHVGIPPSERQPSYLIGAITPSAESFRFYAREIIPGKFLGHGGRSVDSVTVSPAMPALPPRYGLHDSLADRLIPLGEEVTWRVGDRVTVDPKFVDRDPFSDLDTKRTYTIHGLEVPTGLTRATADVVTAFLDQGYHVPVSALTRAPLDMQQL